MLAVIIHLMLERVPFRWMRWLVPAVIAVITLGYTLIFFCHVETPESYQQTRALMMVTGFLLHASLILLPFSRFRKYFTIFPHSAVILFTGILTIFLLTSFGMMGGERMYPYYAEFQIKLDTLQINVVMFIVATGVYGMTALFEALLAPDFIEINYFGRLTRLFPRLELHTFTIEDPVLLPAGDGTAVLTYQCYEELMVDKKRMKGTFHVTALYRWNGKQWKLILWQITPFCDR